MLGRQEVRPVPYIASSRDARPPRSPPSTLHRVESRCSAAKKSAQYPTSRRVAMLGRQEVRPVPYIASSRGVQPLRSPPSTLHRVESRCTAAKKSAQYPTLPRVAVHSRQEVRPVPYIASSRDAQRSRSPGPQCAAVMLFGASNHPPHNIPRTNPPHNQRRQPPHATKAPAVADAFARLTCTLPKSSPLHPSATCRWLCLSRLLRRARRCLCTIHTAT